jgi:hypothetical protein
MSVFKFDGNNSIAISTYVISNQSKVMTLSELTNCGAYILYNRRCPGSVMFFSDDFLSALSYCKTAYYSRIQQS